MGTLSINAMKDYLSSSLSSVNQNKVRGLLAEIEFRRTLAGLGFDDRVSPGGWIARSTEEGCFGHNIIAIFPETIIPGEDYDTTYQPL